jgi:hypothetical protein
MKILIAFKYSALRSLSMWKGVLLIWFSSLLTAGMIAVPLKHALLSGFSDSMITGRLAHGISLEVFSDLGPVMKSLMSFMSGGLIMAVLVWFLLNAFFTGGVFHGLKNNATDFTIGHFLRDSAGAFWSFLVINSIMTAIFLVVLFLVVILPVSLVSQSGSPDDRAIMIAVRLSLYLFLLIASILLLSADYARAWQAANKRNACFRAIGFGFGHTFRTFFLSWPAMVLILVVQALFGWLVISVLPVYSPVSVSGVYLLFFMSQFFFFVKILLKVWRYGCVTSLMEQKKNK